jgi:outer membrane protein, heavy metal efflux system
MRPQLLQAAVSAEKSMFHSLRRALWHVLVLVVATTGANAQAPAPDPIAGGTLTLRDAIAQALARNPDLEGFAFRLRAQEARVRTAALRPPTELRAELENFAGTGAAQGTDVAEATFSLSHVLELGNKRGLRTQAAQATHDGLSIERQAAQLDVVAEVTRRFVHVASDQEQIALTRRATALAQESLDAVRRRVSAGRAPDAELNRANVALARARIEEEHAEHELLSSRRKLSAMWGSTDARFESVAGYLYEHPALLPFEEFVARLERNPDFLRFASEARVRDAELRLSQAKARADVSLTAGVRRLEVSDDQAFVVGVSVPLFGRSRARGAMDEAQALRNLSDTDEAGKRVRTNAQLFELYQELRHSITEATVLRDTVIPELEAALRNTQLAFDRGRYSYLEWTDAQRELVAAQRDRIEASANAHLFLAEIERLTSAPISGTP